MINNTAEAMVACAEIYSSTALWALMFILCFGLIGYVVWIFKDLAIEWFKHQWSKKK